MSSTSAVKRIGAFSKRNFLEIIRDPLSYIFCLGFPLVMLVVMTLVNESIPPEAGMTVFRIDNLAGGIAFFGLTFVMLFIALTISKDRSGAFLVRLYATPMTSGNFIAGYILPMVGLSAIQCVITLAVSLVVAAISDVTLNAGGAALAVIALLPTMLLMIGFGLLFGTVFNEKSAPGLCSIIISLGSFLGGVWFDAEATGGVLLKICNILPFFHSVKAARMACALDFSGDFFTHLLITAAYAAVVLVGAIVAFRLKMRADLR